MDQFNIKDIQKPYKIKQEDLNGFKLKLEEKAKLTNEQKKDLI